MIDRFKQCLFIISHTRAGSDYYDMPAAQKEAERQEARQAMTEARTIWRDNPAEHDALLEAFRASQPLVTMDEIERAP